MTHYGLISIEFRSDLKILNLSLFRFIKQSGFQNHDYKLKFFL